MAEIKIPDLTGVQDSLTDLAHRSGYPPSFKAYLGKGDGVTITDPDYPTQGANRYVWYYTESGRQGKAILQGGTIPYANQAEYHGLPVQIGRLPAAFNIPGEVVLGLGGIEGMSAAGGTQIVENLITNNYYTSLDKMTTLRPEPSATPDMNVSITGDFIYTNPSTGVLTRFATSTISLSSLQGACTSGKHRIAVICLDPTTNTLTTVSSTPVTATSTLPYRAIFTYTDVLALSLAGYIRIAPVYLYYGQTAVTESDILRSLDVRSIFFPPELVQPPVFTGATGTVAGAKGQVPAPGATDNTKFLKGDGSWSAPSGGTGGTPVVSTTKTLQTRTTLYDSTLSTSGTWDVTSLDQTYDHLEIIATVRQSNAVTAGDMYVNFNNDSTAGNYTYDRLYGDGGAAGSRDATDSGYAGFINGDSSPASSFSIWRAFIPNYAGAQLKEYQANTDTYRTTTSLAHGLFNVIWVSTSAINRIAVKPGGANQFKTGSRLQIIGIKTESVVTSVTGGGGYGTIQNAGSALAQESTLNFIAGSNVTLTIADNPGSTRTDVTIASTGGGSAPSGAANLVYATPNLSSGSASLRALVATDIPNGIDGVKIGAGAVGVTYGGTGSNLLATGPGFLKQTSSGANLTVAALSSGDIPNLAASILTSGAVTLARGGTNADLSATGGASQVLRQSSAGAAITVSQLAYSDLSGSIAASQVPVANVQKLQYNPGANIDTTSTTFVACSTTNLRLTMTPSKSGASVLLMASLGAFKNIGGAVFYDFFIDGTTTRLGGTNGLLGFVFGPGGAWVPVTVVGIATGLSTSSHTFDLCFRSNDTNVARVAANTPVSFVAIEL